MFRINILYILIRFQFFCKESHKCKVGDRSDAEGVPAVGRMDLS
jgi:hypothetical protein